MMEENINIENQLIVKYLMHQLSEDESALIASLEELYWANQMREMQELADINN